jgi:hypothetical protein
MAMARMSEGVPIVQDHNREVALWADDEGDAHGFVLSPAAAVTLANRLLAVAEEIDAQATLSIPVDSVDLQVGHDDAGEERVCLVFKNIVGATTRCDMDVTRFAEMTAACRAAMDDIDRPKPPR